MADVIPGIKLITHNARGVFNPDDPSYPYKLKGSFSPPVLMEVAFVVAHRRGEQIVLRGMTHEALEQFIVLNRLQNHLRLQMLRITGPDGYLNQIK